MPIDIDRNIEYDLTAVACMCKSFVYTTYRKGLFFFLLLLIVLKTERYWMSTCMWKTHVSRTHFGCCSIRQTDTHRHTCKIDRWKFQSINIHEHLTAKSQTASLNFIHIDSHSFRIYSCEVQVDPCQNKMRTVLTYYSLTKTTSDVLFVPSIPTSNLCAC